MLRAVTTAAPATAAPAVPAPGGVADAPAVAPGSAAPRTPEAIARAASGDRLKALIQDKRAQLDLVTQAQADARLGTPEAIGAFERQSAALLAWLAAREPMPAHAPYAEFFRSWLASAADLYLAARPLPTLEARQARYAQLDETFRTTRSEADRALLAAAARELAATTPAFAPGTPSDEVRRALAPALGHLARSSDPAAQALARRIEGGEIPFKVTTGGRLGVQYFAMVALSGITLSNGEVGPSFFALSPVYQAAVLRHEYTHVLQKEGVRGYLGVLGGNLAQRLLALAGRLPFVDGDRLEVLGRRWNRAEQAAYRAEKDFLTALGWGDRGLLIPDMGMLEGVDTWLEADALP